MGMGRKRGWLLSGWLLLLMVAGAIGPHDDEDYENGGSAR